jgi:tryptophanyl-tRNA synthetase
MTAPTITLTGVQPTGELHLGNYAGAVRPLARLAAQPARETYVFVADVHALNGRPEPHLLRDRTRRMVAALLACGLDHDRVHVYRQSRVPAIAQLSVLLANVTAKGTLNRAHAYKALVAANAAAGREPDHGVNMGLFTYPVLMAADILAMRAHEVPVGADQAQHLEIAVELARAFARAYGPGILLEPAGGRRGRRHRRARAGRAQDEQEPRQHHPGVRAARAAGPARPPDRDRQPPARGPQGPGRLRAGRAARHLRGSRGGPPGA